MPWDLADAERKDAELVEAIEDLTPVTREWEGILVAEIEANFASESAADEPFQPLAESTLRDRARKGFAPGPILERTGNLKAAATAIRQHDAEGAEVGADDAHPYAGFHASLEPRARLPLRDFLAIREEAVEKGEAALIEHLERHHG